MKYYAGLDVAMKETFMCVLDETGKRIFESKCSTDPQPIYDELAKSGVLFEKVGLYPSPYLFRGRCPSGFALCRVGLLRSSVSSSGAYPAS